MAKVKDVAARDKIIRARTNMLVSNGFFGFLAMQLRLVEVADGHIFGMEMKTMAVDGFNLYYYPEFVHKLTELQCQGVVAHEVMHCCFQHFSRRGHRDALIWNIAGDHVINLDLLASGFELPEPRCSDPKYKGWTTEAVYDDVWQNAKKIMVKGFGDGKGMDPGGCGGVLDPQNGESGKSEASTTWETNVRTAVAVAKANNAGNLPGSLQKLVDQLNEPKVSWRELTRRFVDQSLTKEVSWSRLSRRSVSIGALLPGRISDRLQHLVCFVDISGSISFDLCREMVSECAGALDQGTADKLTIVYTDTEVKHIDEYYAGDVVEAGRYDGGGTDFRAAFNWLNKEVTDASCVIFLTDLCVNQFGDEPTCPVLWAVYAPDTHYDQLAANAPFGQTVHIGNNWG